MSMSKRELEERVEELERAIEQMVYFARAYGWPRKQEEALKRIEEIGAVVFSPKQEEEK